MVLLPGVWAAMATMAGRIRTVSTIHTVKTISTISTISTASTACQLCHYTTPNQANLLKHYALGHSMLDEYLQDQDLVDRKRVQYQNKPKKMSFGPDCPICDAKGRDRDHVARHFLEELYAMLPVRPKTRYWTINCHVCLFAQDT